MGKHLARVEDSPIQAQPICAHCGWNCNDRVRVECKPGRFRTYQRMALAINGGKLLCDICHTKLLLETGRMQMHQTPAERLWRDAVYP